MKQRDVLVLMDGIAPAIASLLMKATAPLVARLDATEKQLADALAALAARPDVEAIVAAAVAKAMASRPQEEPVDLVAIERRIDERFAALPQAKEVDRGELTGLVSAEVGKVAATLPVAPTAAEVAALVPTPQPGKDADPAHVAALIAAEVEKAVAAQPKIPTAQEVAALVPKPLDGKSVSSEEIHSLVDQVVGAAFATVSVPRDGKDVEIDAVRELVLDAVSALPKPENGKDATPEAIAAAVEAVLATWPRPQDGKSVDADTVRNMVAEAVGMLPKTENGKDAAPEAIAAAVEVVLASWPKPKDGASVTLSDVQPLVEEEVGKALAARPAAKDGVGLAGALKDHEGCLVLTLTNGTMVKLGRIDGQDGEPGLDGLGFDDLEVLDGAAEFTLRLVRGERVKEWTLAKPTLADCYRGVWREGSFKAGDAVTWGGSLWIAQRATEAKPETNDDWKLAVKRGRDGKDAATVESKGAQQVKLK